MADPSPDEPQAAEEQDRHEWTSRYPYGEREKEEEEEKGKKMSGNDGRTKRTESVIPIAEAWLG